MKTVFILLLTTILNIANIFVEKKSLSFLAILLSLTAIYQLKKKRDKNENQ